ncbi:hypothetical protein EDF81_2193 [Enterobacter sp. BIGb0383]|uniref:hypothetical protein n=1 Tax=unclassified Enterobacter TaxID=2608935 RepID=UPI000FBABEBB|nr:MULTISPECIES: hypothetical protein [unclassified Enterobacter]ROP59394.1 hypothetical protein EDF81_2193 [Enterobacter sp. BIGb0383]ROS09140.1 hypothetical protein EC848_2647 [Enterobacter sp. BIGb0359]
MVKGKIKAGKLLAAENKIVARTPSSTATTLSFSFQYIDPAHAKFRFSGQTAVYFCKVLKRLKDISSLTLLEFTTNRNASLKSHCIVWDTTSEPEGFTHFNEQFQSVTPYQFAITRNEHGRIHGFFIGNVFHVVWLDPDHQLYPVQ